MGFYEIKLSEAQSNIHFNFDGYIFRVKLRKKKPHKKGKVAFLVKKTLPFTQNLKFDIFHRELLAIRNLNKKGKNLLYVCLNNPPKNYFNRLQSRKMSG